MNAITEAFFFVLGSKFMVLVSGDLVGWFVTDWSPPEER